MEQGLAGDAAFVVIGATDMAALDDREYRDAQLAAGIVEGRLHLLAYAQGASASGMTFIDSEVPATVGEPLDGLLLTCIGVPEYRSARGVARRSDRRADGDAALLTERGSFERQRNGGSASERFDAHVPPAVQRWRHAGDGARNQRDDGRMGRVARWHRGRARGRQPLTPNAKSLSPNGAVSDGPIGPMVSGYSLIKARSMEEAVEMAKGCPAKLSGASISIFEVM